MISRKNIFKSTTVLSALVAVLIETTELISPIILGEKELQSNDITSLVSVLGTSTLVIVGRLNAKQALYTSKFLPGPNRDDIVTAVETIGNTNIDKSSIESMEEEINELKDDIENIEVKDKLGLHLVGKNLYDARKDEGEQDGIIKVS